MSAVSLKHQQKTNTITMNPFDLNRERGQIFLGKQFKITNAEEMYEL